MITKRPCHAKVPSPRALLGAALLALLLAARPAQARDMTGKGGVGALLTAAGMPMASFRYWRTNFALELLGGYVTSRPAEPQPGNQETTQLRLAVGLLYRLADSQRASLAVGLRPWLQYFVPRDPAAADNPSTWRFGAELPLQAELFLNDHVSLVGLVGLTIDVGKPLTRGDGADTALERGQGGSDIVIGMRGGFSGGAGVSYYF